MKDRKIKLPPPIKESVSKKLSDYTTPELDRIRRLANFTELEEEYFTLRSKGKSNVATFVTMNISESKMHSIRRSVESKIKRVS